MPSSGKRSLVLLLCLSAGLGVWWAVRPKEEHGPTALPSPSAAEITGCVRNQYGPLAAARVRIKGTAITALTGPDGRFHLPVKTGPVTAWKDGYFIGGRALDLLLRPLPAADNPAYRWVDPTPDPKETGNCANCHAEIYREWAASGHSRSASGRHFRNLYEGTNWNGEAHVGWGLLTQHADGAGVCASCHAPAIPDEERAAREDLRNLAGIAAQGVHCDYCHKIAGVGTGEIGQAHGRYNLRLLRPAQQQLFFGPLDDVDRNEDAYSPLYRASLYCASCHEGTVFGVHVYSTYSEWLASPAKQQGKQCQDCHMTPTGKMTNFAPGHGGIERDPRTLGNHRFFAPSQEEMLRHSLHVETDARRTATGVHAVVRITAEDVGHRVPTGFIDRHLILSVEALDAEGKSLGSTTGPTLPPAAGTELNGRPGQLFARLLRGEDGRSPAPFWAAETEPVDTRLRPGQVESLEWTFPAATAQLRVRLLYRRFWDDVAAKGWPDRPTVVHDRTTLPR